MRNCGSCSLCCTVLYVPELRKKQNVKCQHCEHGCAIYVERPESCKTFECQWLKGDMGEEMRPDKIHVVIENLPNVPVVLALLEPGYSISNKMTTMLNSYKRKGFAVVCKRQALLPVGMTQDEVVGYVKQVGRSMGVLP